MEFKDGKYMVSSICRDIERDKSEAGTRIVFKFSTQRESGQWSKADQSMLIDSVLRDYDIPTVLLSRNLNDDVAYVLDGVQRITTLYNFVNNGFKLSRDIKPYTYRRNGEMVDEVLAGKFFKGLSKPVQDKITDYTLNVRYMLNATEEEINEQMFRSNICKPLTSTQKSVIKLGLEKCDEVKSLLDNKLFSQRIAYTVSQVKRSEGLKCCITTLAVLNDLKYGKLSSATDMNKIADSLKADLSERQIAYCDNLLSILNNMLPVEVSDDILTTTNIPILVMNVEKYQQMLEDGEITEEQYKQFLAWWCEKGYFTEEFQNVCDKKSINTKTGVDARINAMENALIDFVNDGISEAVEPDTETEIPKDTTSKETTDNAPIYNSIPASKKTVVNENPFDFSDIFSRELLDEDDEDDESNEEERGLSKEEFAKMIDDIMAS